MDDALWMVMFTVCSRVFHIPSERSILSVMISLSMMVMHGLQSNLSTTGSGSNEVHLSRALLVTRLLEICLYQAN